MVARVSKLNTIQVLRMYWFDVSNAAPEWQAGSLG